LLLVFLLDWRRGALWYASLRGSPRSRIHNYDTCVYTRARIYVHTHACARCSCGMIKDRPERSGAGAKRRGITLIYERCKSSLIDFSPLTDHVFQRAAYARGITSLCSYFNSNYDIRSR
jgi:hypothetical protein